MEYISKVEDWTIKYYDGLDGDGDYKLSDYAIVVQYKDGYALFHTITWSLFFMTNDEYEKILSNDFFIKSKIVVREGTDEYHIAESVYKERSIKPDYNRYENLNYFVILTTNECNANCFYCYEKSKHGNMTKELADKVINFIDEKHNGTVGIQWFGGEPLKNYEIIDYISQSLTEKGIEFNSTMITNGSLFSNDIIKKAKDLWNLKEVQITIDGVEDYYNKIKNYDDFNKSAFETVIDNIKNIIINSNIKVNIRINVSHENIDSIDELINDLNYRFFDIGLSNVRYYLSPLYEIVSDVNLYKKDNFNLKLERLMKTYFPLDSVNIIKKHNIMRCMADNCGNVVISPNGTIFNCEHMTKNSLIGSIDDGISNIGNIENTVNKLKGLDYCKSFNCKLIPICERTSFCDTFTRCVSEDTFKYDNEKFVNKIKSTIDYYFDKKKYCHS